jgi:transposase InsO family protein
VHDQRADGFHDDSGLLQEFAPRGLGRSLAAPWRSFEQIELATARWVDWYDSHRLHSSIGDVPPAEFEAAYYANNTTVDAA